MLNQDRASLLARHCNTIHVLMSKLLFLHSLVKIVEHFWLFFTKILHNAPLKMVHVFGTSFITTMLRALTHVVYNV